jgi:transcription-repair coupling factor (superfamily II helicase)
VYQSGKALQHKVMARGLGVLPMDKQLEQLMEWLRLMAAQIPDADGTTAAQRLEVEGQRNEAVLRV